MKQIFGLLSLTTLVLMGLTTSAWALPLTFTLVGVDNPALRAEVTFEYTPSSGTIKIDITNTSLSDGGLDPRLTAFAFNAPTDVTGISNLTGPSGWLPLFDRDNINTPGQFGMFDAAGITNENDNFNGGNADVGIPLGFTFSFEFVLAGSNLNALNELSFLSLGSNDPAGPPDEAEPFFIARFQRTDGDGEGSDKAVPSGEPMPIPEPSSLFLLGIGLLGVAGITRLRRQRP